MDFETAYETLGIAETATQGEIKTAFRKLAYLYHPDHCKRPDATQLFQRLNTAYYDICDPVKRQRYDAVIKQKRAEANAANRARHRAAPPPGAQQPPPRQGPRHQPPPRPTPPPSQPPPPVPPAPAPAAPTPPASASIFRNLCWGAFAFLLMHACLSEPGPAGKYAAPVVPAAEQQTGRAVIENPLDNLGSSDAQEPAAAPARAAAHTWHLENRTDFTMGISAVFDGREPIQGHLEPGMIWNLSDTSAILDVYYNDPGDNAQKRVRLPSGSPGGNSYYFFRPVNKDGIALFSN